MAMVFFNGGKDRQKIAQRAQHKAIFLQTTGRKTEKLCKTPHKSAKKKPKSCLYNKKGVLLQRESEGLPQSKSLTYF